MRRLQKEISTSRLSWPVTAAITLVFWFIAWLEDNVTFLPLVLLMATGLLMMWINHLFALIKVFSRMIASSYLALTTAMLIVPDIGGEQLRATFVQFCLVTFLILHFSCYQYRKAQGVMLYAFLMLGIASLVFKQILFIIPILWLLTSVCMVPLNAKIWLSSLFGIGLPYLFVFTYYMLIGTPFAEQTLMSNWEFSQAFSFTSVSKTLVVSYIATSLLSLLGIIHLLREGHKDKVRTRMMYQVFIFIAVFAFIMTIIQPQNIAVFTAIQLISTSAMLGHFFAMTDTKYTNYTFISITAFTYMLILYHLIF